jgi:hypothetical protein
MPVDGGRPGSIVSVVGRSKALSGVVVDVQDSGQVVVVEHRRQLAIMY